MQMQMQNPFQALTAVQKAYHEDNLKYSGVSDSLSRKMNIFHDICLRFQLPQHMIVSAFPSSLISPALEFYNSNIGKWQTHEAIVGMMRTHFEGSEYEFEAINQWEDISLQVIMAKSPGKPVSERLPLLFNEIQTISYRIPPEQQTDHNQCVQ